MCAVSVISACSSLKRVYRIATVATITAIVFLVLGSKSSCITPLPTHTHTTHTHTHTHPHGQGEPEAGGLGRCYGSEYLCPLSHNVRDFLGTLRRTDTHGRAARYVSGGPLIRDCVVCVYGGVCASLYESVSLGELLLLVSTI